MDRNVRGVRSGAGRRSALWLALAAFGLGGCFDAPKLEDRWTRVDILNSNLTASQAVAASSMLPVAVSARVTYRAIVTGYAVTELRASSTVSPSSVTIHPNAPRLVMAEDIDRVLQNSVTRGRAIRAVTGWDHLMQDIDFTFNGAVPAAGDSAAGPSGGLFLLCYLGSGVKVELPSGADTIIVTPFPSTQYQILPIGMALAVQ